MIGLARGKVELVSYQKEWKGMYEKEEKLLLDTIGEYILDIQHVGSTSIPDISAKPITDTIGIEKMKQGLKCIEPLENLGYEYKGSAGIEGRHFFAKGYENNRTHYLHFKENQNKLDYPEELTKNFFDNFRKRPYY